MADKKEKDEEVAKKAEVKKEVVSQLAMEWEDDEDNE
jgi:hypothetical protein